VQPEELPVELAEERRPELRSELQRKRPLSSSLEVKKTKVKEKEKVKAKERRTMVCAMKNETKEFAVNLVVSSSTIILIPETPPLPPEHGADALEGEEVAVVKAEEKERKSSRRSSIISFANTLRPENLQIVSKGGGNVSTAT